MIYPAGELTISITMNSYLKMALSICFAATALVAGTIAYAVMKGPGEQEIVDNDMLTSFSSYDELASLLSQSPSYSNGSAYYRQDTGAQETLGAGTGGDSPSYSTTNVQVAGVDESDVVKTDGEYIYIASYSMVYIVKAYPPEEMANVTVLALADLLGFEPENMSGYISGLYLYQDKLIVVLSVYEYIPWYWYAEGGDNYTQYLIRTWTAQRTLVSVFDIQDVWNPVLDFSYGVSGYELTSRMIDSNLYLVAQSYVWMLDEAVYLPLLWAGDTSSEFEIGNIYYDPGTPDSSSFMNLLAVDVLDGDFEYKSVVGGYASVVYMSYDALYLTIQKWDGQVILVGSEAAPEDEWTTRTSIYKITVEGLSMVTAAKGTVKGWLLNQFSLDEHDGYLRVATTTSWTEPKNGVYVLDSDLIVVGKLEGLAPTERIFSARFMGDTLYLVTFRQVDPLFVIDLSDPSSPEVVGELKIPGFSSYLHPVDADHVLGIGYENSSVKITLFDVSDPTRPVEQSTYRAEKYSWSPAAYDHKAVLFDLERELLVIPMTVYTYDSPNYSYWSGAYVFDVSVTDGVALRGKVLQNEFERYDWVMRALYIEDSLYTVAHHSVKASSLDDLSEQGFLIYYERSDYYYAIASEAASER